MSLAVRRIEVFHQRAAIVAARAKRLRRRVDAGTIFAFNIKLRIMYTVFG